MNQTQGSGLIRKVLAVTVGVAGLFFLYTRTRSSKPLDIKEQSVQTQIVKPPEPQKQIAPPTPKTQPVVTITPPKAPVVKETTKVDTNKQPATTSIFEKDDTIKRRFFPWNEK